MALCVCLSASTSSVAAAERKAAVKSEVAPKSWTDQITRNIVKRVGKWSTVRPTVDGLWFYGRYAEVAYNTGNSGGMAIYVHTAGTWRLVCGGSGALDRTSAETVCGLSTKDAAGLLRHE